MTPTTRPVHTCGGCDVTWLGIAMCHCSVCHVTFGAITSFDRHRKGGDCQLPASIGLYFNETRKAWSEPFSWARDDGRDTEERVEDIIAAFNNAPPEQRGKTRRPTDEERAADHKAAAEGTLPRRTINIHADHSPDHHPDTAFLGWLSFGDIEDGGWIGPE